MTGPRSTPELVVANLGLLAASFFWGSFYALTEHVLATWDPFTVTTVRLVVGALAILLFLGAREGWTAFHVGVPWRRVWILGGIGLGVYMFFLTFGVLYAGAIPSAIVYATTPIVAAFMARAIFGERIAPRLVAAALVAVAGGAVMVVGTGWSVGAFQGGEVLIGVSVVLFTWYSLLAQRWLAGLSQLRLTALTIGAAGTVGLVIYLGLLAVGHFVPKVDLSLSSLLYMAYLSVAPLSLAVAFWNYGVSRVGVTIAAIYYNLGPVFAVLVAMWLGGVPTAQELVGGAIVMAAVALAQFRLPRRA